MSDIYQHFEKQFNIKSQKKVNKILTNNNIISQNELYYDFTAELTLPFKLENIIEIPTGIYEIKDIDDYIKKYLPKDQNLEFNLTTNPNTLKTIIYFDREINFNGENSIGPLLGFEKRILKKKTMHTSDSIAKIFRVNTIRLECNLISGAYINNKPVRTIHSFFPQVSGGFKLVEVPNSIIYLQVAVKTIHTLNVRIVDQDDNLINFQGETITIRLHIKKNIT